MSICQEFCALGGIFYDTCRQAGSVSPFCPGKAGRMKRNQKILPERQDFLIGHHLVCLFDDIGGGFFVGHAEQEDTRNDVNKEQNADLPTGRHLVILHLAQGDEAENQGQNIPATGDHANDNKNLCRSLHVFSPYVRISFRQF